MKLYKTKDRITSLIDKFNMRLVHLAVLDGVTCKLCMRLKQRNVDFKSK